jgi:hypothetical protein
MLLFFSLRRIKLNRNSEAILNDIERVNSIYITKVWKTWMTILYRESRTGSFIAANYEGFIYIYPVVKGYEPLKIIPCFIYD